MISANVIIYEYLCPSIHHWWDYRCLNVTKLCVHHVTHGDYCGFVNFSLGMGSLGRLTSSSCSVKSAWPGALPHLASPPPYTQQSFHPVERDQGPVNVCQGLSGCRAANGSMLNAFALISADWSLLRIDFWYCLLLLHFNRSTFLKKKKFSSFSSLKKKNHCLCFSRA